MMDGLARSSGLSFGGQLLRAALNAILFVVVARVLGIDGFGSFASSVALVSLAATFANLGAMGLMVRRNARDAANVAGDFSSAVAVTVGCGLIVCLILCIVNLLANPINVPSGILFLVAASDLVGYRLSELSGAAALQARDWIFGTAYFPALVGLGRLVGVLIACYFADHVGLASVVISYSIGSVVVAVLVVIGTTSTVGVAWPNPASFLRQWREGLMYSIGLSAQGVYNDIDKVMLASLSGLGSAGVYAAAYRAIDLAFVPTRAVLSATYVRLFRLGTSSAENSARLAISLLKPSLALSGVASLMLFLGASSIPSLLGSEYVDAVSIVRLLAVIPILRTLHHLAADSLTGAGKQGIRTAWQVVMAISNFAIKVPVHRVTGLVQERSTVYAHSTKCSECGAPMEVRSRSDWQLLQRSRYGRCSACIANEKARLQEADARRREEQRETQETRAALVQQHWAVRDGVQPDPEALSMESAFILASLLEDGDEISTGIIPPLVSRVEPLAPGVYDVACLSRVLQEGLLQIHPDSAIDAFHWVDTDIPERYSAAKASHYPPGSGKLSDRVRAYRHAFSLLVAQEAWPVHWELEMPGLWRSLAAAECEACLTFLMDDYGLPFSAGERTRETFALGLQNYSIGQMYYFIWRAARDAAAYSKRDRKISLKQRVPVVALPVACLYEMIPAFVPGTLARAVDPKSLAEAVQATVESPPSNENVHAAWTRRHERFAPSVVAGQWLREFQTVQ